MSHDSNTNLIERAEAVSAQYVGTYLPDAIDGLIKSNNLEALEYMVSEAEAEIIKFDNQVEEMTDERAEDMYQAQKQEDRNWEYEQDATDVA